MRAQATPGVRTRWANSLKRRTGVRPPPPLSDPATRSYLQSDRQGLRFPTGLKGTAALPPPAPAALGEAKSCANATGRRRSKEKLRQQECRGSAGGRRPGPGKGSRLPLLSHRGSRPLRGGARGAPSRALPPDPRPVAPALTAPKPGSAQPAVAPLPGVLPGVPPCPPRASPAGGGARAGRPDWSDSEGLRALLRGRQRQFQHWGGANSGTQQLIGQLRRSCRGGRFSEWGGPPEGGLRLVRTGPRATRVRRRQFQSLRVRLLPRRGMQLWDAWGAGEVAPGDPFFPTCFQVVNGPTLCREALY